MSKCTFEFSLKKKNEVIIYNMNYLSIEMKWVSNYPFFLDRKGEKMFLYKCVD